MIHIRNITVQFGGVKAIDALDAQLDDDVCGLIGPNGAGKTTLVNLLSGLARSSGGQVHVDGRGLLSLSPAERVRFGLRRSFQTEQVVEDLSVWDNIRAIIDHLPHPRRTAIHQVASALEYTGLSAIATESARSLNLFQRRMVEIAKTLVGEPKLVLLDEPGAGLSEQESLWLRTVIVGIPDHCGAQVLLIDHDVELIAATCTQTLVMDFGRRLALGPTRAVLDDPAVRLAYLGT